MYRLFGPASDLLYVGITNDIRRRFQAHAQEKPWWPDVIRDEIVWYPTRRQALREEARAIVEENPRYNKAGRDRHRHYEPVTWEEWDSLDEWQVSAATCERTCGGTWRVVVEHPALGEVVAVVLAEGPGAAMVDAERLARVGIRQWVVERRREIGPLAEVVSFVRKPQRRPGPWIPPIAA